MEKYSYGPLIYNTTADEDDSGNFYWNGMPPVGYDDMGIPIDPNGNQCLPFECPLHPNHSPSAVEYNNWLEDELPTWKSFEEWFDDNFINVTPRDIYFFIIRWYSLQPDKLEHLQDKAGPHSIPQIVDLAWPDAQKS